jgi:hypothetical protein
MKIKSIELLEGQQREISLVCFFNNESAPTLSDFESTEKRFSILFHFKKIF